MTRLIDADGLFSWYEGSKTKYPVTKDHSAYSTMMMYEIFDEIDDAPTVDAEVVVRCKDCKHTQNDVGMGNYRWCDIVCGSRRSDDFCSYGERKGEHDERLNQEV